MLLRLVRSVLLLVELITSPRFSKCFPWPCLIQARCSCSWSHLYRKRLGVKGRRGREKRGGEPEPHPEKDYSTCSFISWSAKCPLLCLWMENGMEEWAGIYRAFEKQLVSACAPNMPSTSFNREKASSGFLWGTWQWAEDNKHCTAATPAEREIFPHLPTYKANRKKYDPSYFCPACISLQCCSQHSLNTALKTHLSQKRQ